jgi:hypothetical protein
MSLNVIAACPYAIICASDRRLVDLLSGTIRTNRSTKMTIFACADAHGAVVYNGIGLDDQSLTPSDWLLELEKKEKLFSCGLQEVLHRVGTDLETRLHKLRAKYGPEKARHTFVFTAWHEGTSGVYGVSNYERVDNTEELPEGSENVVQSACLSQPGALIRIVATGVHPRMADLHAISEAVKTGPLKRVTARCVKVVRDVAYGKGAAKGAVGASAQWAVVGPERDQVSCGLDVVGGPIAQETPNLINIGAEVHLGGTLSVRMGGPGMLIKETYVGDERARSVASYDPSTKTVAFSEPQCGICGTPWPASHRFCEVCLHETHRARSKKQRRRN